ncbi:MAG: hypothetical protein PF442_11825 [Desulfobulbaceae bacterium]|jgi:hypothetical protein|nr:hypothetical protein [Desulfobulbaceae bacterium]
MMPQTIAGHSYSSIVTPAGFGLQATAFKTPVLRTIISCALKYLGVLCKRSPGLKLGFVCCILLLFPENCQALQSHGTSEGVYVHQMAHIYFIAGLIYLYWDIKRSACAGQGWRYLRMFCLFMIGWNVVAFTGHMASVAIGAEQIFTGGGYLHHRILSPISSLELVYYLTRFDHLLAVPALFCLYLAMRNLNRSAGQDTGGLTK